MMTTIDDRLLTMTFDKIKRERAARLRANTARINKQVRAERLVREKREKRRAAARQAISPKFIRARVKALRGPAKAMWPTACHEAGHALAARLLGAFAISVHLADEGQGPGGYASYRLPNDDRDGIYIVSAAGAVGARMLTGKGQMSTSDAAAISQLVNGDLMATAQTTANARAYAERLLKKHRVKLLRTAWRTLQLWMRHGNGTFAGGDIFDRKYGTA